jgi:hypothetical protein
MRLSKQEGTIGILAPQQFHAKAQSLRKGTKEDLELYFAPSPELCAFA